MKPLLRIVIALLFVLSPAHLFPQTPRAQKPPTAKNANASQMIEPGRYQVVFSPHARADTFLVDTVSGKVWHLVKYKNIVGEPEVWLYIDRIDNFKEKFEWGQSHELKPNPDGFIPD